MTMSVINRHNINYLIIININYVKNTQNEYALSAVSLHKINQTVKLNG